MGPATREITISSTELSFKVCDAYSYIRSQNRHLLQPRSLEMAEHFGEQCSPKCSTICEVHSFCSS